MNMKKKECLLMIKCEIGLYEFEIVTRMYRNTFILFNRITPSRKVVIGH